MKRKMSVINPSDNLIFAKLDYILALVKLMIAETRYGNSLYAKKIAQAT